MNGNENLVFVSPDLRPGIIEAVQGIAASGSLKQFVTTVALSERAYKVVGGLPGAPRRRLTGNLRGKVTTYPSRELVRTVARRLSHDEVWLDKVWWWAEHGFDLTVARNWAGKAEFVYGFELASAETFKAQKRLGCSTILSQLIAHPGTAQRLIGEEMERYPDAVTAYDRHLLKLVNRINAIKDEQFELSDLIIANSDFVRQSFVDAGISPDKIAVVPGASPVEVGANQSERSHDRVVFLSAGLQSIRKGTPYLLDAWRQLKSHTGGELWLVGKNTLPARLLADLPGKVVIRPTVSRAELFDLYRQASVLVLPSLCEGFALVILEAMAHGLPVITTPNSGCGEFVEDGVNGWIVPVQDAKALGDRISWCNDNAERLEEMGEVSRRKASGWTWDDYMQEHTQLISEFTRRPVNFVTSPVPQMSKQVQA